VNLKQRPRIRRAVTGGRLSRLWDSLAVVDHAALGIRDAIGDDLFVAPDFIQSLCDVTPLLHNLTRVGTGNGGARQVRVAGRVLDNQYGDRRRSPSGRQQLGPVNVSVVIHSDDEDDASSVVDSIEHAVRPTTGTEQTRQVVS
jgi:hypothetical protein